MNCLCHHFSIFFPPNLFRILTLEQLVVTVEIKRFVLIYASLQPDFFFTVRFVRLPPTL